MEDFVDEAHGVQLARLDHLLSGLHGVIMLTGDEIVHLLCEQPHRLGIGEDDVAGGGEEPFVKVTLGTDFPRDVEFIDGKLPAKLGAITIKHRKPKAASFTKPAHIPSQNLPLVQGRLFNPHINTPFIRFLRLQPYLNPSRVTLPWMCPWRNQPSWRSLPPPSCGFPPAP